MSGLIGRRLVGLVFVILSITLLTFLVGSLAPGDPVLVLMGPRRDPVLAASLRHQYGLDLPWAQQYLRYLGGLLQGDLGMSYRFQGRSVNSILADGIGVSITLGFVALVLSLVLGVPTGIIAALRRNSWIDRSSMVVMLALFSIPTFVMIPILRAFNYFVLYRNNLPSLPPAGWGTPAHWVMPVLVLAAVNMGYLARLTRASMLDTLRQDYIRTAQAKGLRNRTVVGVHALRNALLPIVTVIGPSLAFLVTGSFVVESLFAIPGIGYLGVQAIGQRDYPVIMGTTLLLAVVVVLMNLVTDILYTVLDPRIKAEA